MDLLPLPSEEERSELDRDGKIKRKHDSEATATQDLAWQGYMSFLWENLSLPYFIYTQESCLLGKKTQQEQAGQHSNMAAADGYESGQA